jgi:hypothetical protein
MGERSQTLIEKEVELSSNALMIRDCQERLTKTKIKESVRISASESKIETVASLIWYRSGLDVRW